MWVWVEKTFGATAMHELYAKECTVSIVPRPSYCDRGRWEVHVLDGGFPINPSPIDAADMFPRLFFDLGRAKAEMETWMKVRNYTPGTELDRENHH